MQWWQQALVAVLVPLVAGGITWLNSKGNRAHSMIDQQQEEIERLTKRVGVIESHERIREDYIYLLRGHIASGLPPPPPEWPPGLRQ